MEDPQQLVENGQSHQTNEWFGGTTISGILLMKYGGFKTPIMTILLGNIRFENNEILGFTKETLGIYQQSWARNGRVHQQKMMALTNRTLDSTINILD